MSPDVMQEIDWVLSANLAWALQVEEIAHSRGFTAEDVTEFACVRMLLQLRAAGLS